GAGTLVARADGGAPELFPKQTVIRAEELRAVQTKRGAALLVAVPSAKGDGAVVAIVRTDPEAVASAPLLKLVALYTGVVALALLVFAYFAMTRLVVRPLVELGHAAGRVADGARRFEVPRGGPQELRDLAADLIRMTERMRADETALREK